ncbi:MAG: hypothetical protein U9N87_03135 [Planctomycetota bacterium]|nr:hypothetical protein [Planctomycetota bacterium]
MTAKQRRHNIWYIFRFITPALSGRGGWHYQTTVDPRLANGPEGTVLVENLKKNPSKTAGRPCGTRYWADPARGYALRQVQYLKTGQAADSKKGLVEMQQLALSPSGLWYPLVVRHVKNVHNDNGKTSDFYSRGIIYRLRSGYSRHAVRRA